MQCKHNIYISKIFNISKIDKYWYQRKSITKLFNYGSYLSPKIYRFDNRLNDDEYYNICDMENNNEVE